MAATFVAAAAAARRVAGVFKLLATMAKTCAASAFRRELSSAIAQPPGF